MEDRLMKGSNHDCDDHCHCERLLDKILMCDLPLKVKRYQMMLLTTHEQDEEETRNSLMEFHALS
jgi:hypothetical protein